jgi:hypothetical protein
LLPLDWARSEQKHDTLRSSVKGNPMAKDRYLEKDRLANVMAAIQVFGRFHRSSGIRLFE